MTTNDVCMHTTQRSTKRKGTRGFNHSVRHISAVAVLVVSGALLVVSQGHVICSSAVCYLCEGARRA